MKILEGEVLHGDHIVVDADKKPGKMTFAVSKRVARKRASQSNHVGTAASAVLRSLMLLSATHFTPDALSLGTPLTSRASLDRTAGGGCPYALLLKDFDGWVGCNPTGGPPKRPSFARADGAEPRPHTIP